MKELKTYCDRCGKEIKEGDNYAQIRLFAKGNINTQEMERTLMGWCKVIEFCEECHIKFNDFAENNK